MSAKTTIINEGFNTQEYGIAAKKSNQEVIDYVNSLLDDWKADGSLQKLYDKYNLKPAKADNKLERRIDMFLLTAAASPFALSRWADFFANFGEFAKGFLYTLGMSFCALILAFILGVIFGAMSSSKNKILRAIARVYVEVFQNTPLLVQFVFVYYGLAIMTNGAIMISTFFTAVLCVGIYHGAYIAEVIRSGIEAVPKGQTEAALSQGFAYSQTMSLIILPQAVHTILPPLTTKWLT